MEQVRVLSAEFEEDRLVIDVAPSWTNGRCSSCGATGPIRDQRVRRWRHLDVGGVECELRYSIRRVECSSCGVKVEQVPWAEHDTGFTKGFEDLIALMAQKTDKTTVARLLRMASTLARNGPPLLVKTEPGVKSALVVGGQTVVAGRSSPV
jgi:transposase